MERPSVVRSEHLEYLDELRESGQTNMFDAKRWLIAEFPELTKQEAQTILVYWMKTFGQPLR